ncbi:adenylate/guanylate cyclase domain-containing protein [Sulfurimonas sp.]|jgi:adenylate cyclase|uniref:CHASE2 domain-containing protein n=1 Tax=Sulfurimonas sp. TaxID=2022749 RepID=UPI0025F3FB02|nr:adenylate/guanylate cyclase domain-containing protein [Sulfurimonas sp.]MCK9472902.1 adenylate/guanylate cyclase domain-containing protein [Sulfurimonas sp.]
MSKNLAHFFLVVLICTIMITLSMRSLEFFMPFENKIKDLMFKARGEIKGDENIIIVDIDEKSLNSLGQWPWSRDKVATLLQNLSDYGAGIIGLDIVFAEPDNSSPKKVLQKLGLAHEGVVDYDEILAHTITKTPTIIGYVFAMQNDTIAADKSPHSSGIIVEKNRPEKSYLLKPYRPILNIDSINEAAYSSGYFNTVPDSDGNVRSVPLVMEYEGVIYPSLALEMARIIQDKRKIELFYDDNGLSHIALGELNIATDYYGRLNVNFRGAQGSYRYISALDIYEKRVKPAEIEGKIVFLGTSAAGLLDLRSTPFDSVFPGVEVHANALENILSGVFLSKPIWASGVDIITIVVGAFFIFLILLLPSAIGSFLLLVTLNSILIWAHYFYMFSYGVIFNTILPLVAINSIFIIGQAINYFLEIKQKERIKGKFASKVSPAVMDDILASEDNVLEAKEREVTVFFSDVRGFTNISEALKDPKKLIRFMNIYMNPMTEIVIKTGGTVDKFIGDAIMAYWNAPTNVTDHADKAVQASLEQLHSLRELNKTLRDDPEFASVAQMSDANGVPIIDIGIGLNSGTVIVGEMGSSGRSDYTVIGDSVNLGSRLESLCKYYNSKLNISNFTKERLKGKYIYRFLDLVTVKGKSEPIEIWQIHDYDREQEYYLFDVSRKQLIHELALYHKAIELYKEAEFAKALAIFTKIESWNNKTNKAIYNIYIERCEHYIAMPPKNFNGVFIHTSKG